MYRKSLFVLVVSTIFLSPRGGLGQEVNATDMDPPPNIDAKTLGGAQFWSDVKIRHQWRIQRNALTRHFRLLDDKNVRRAWGTRKHCDDSLTRLARELDLPPLRGQAVVALHGLGRTRNSMNKLCQYLADEGGYTAINVSYASTRQSIDEHAANLARILNGLEGIDEINFVAHSMGNLVIRHYLGNQTRDGQDRADPRIKRIVMLAPPNSGSRLAELLKDRPLFRLFLGVSGRELSTQWEAVSKRLATPNCEFGIIAGGRADGVGRNPLLPGNDDLVVSVDETRLAGARDFVTLPVVHTFIMDDPTVQQYTLRFLREGYFVSADKRQPILADRP